MSNYPDDIRQHDNDPRSPIYDDSAERAFDARVAELRGKILTDNELLCEVFMESGPDIQADIFDAITLAINEEPTDLMNAINQLAYCYAVAQAQQDLA